MTSGRAGLERVEIETDRLRLRCLEERDVEGFVVLANDPLVYATTLRLPHPYRAEHARQYIEIERNGVVRGDLLLLAIALRDGDAAVGSIGLTIDWPHRRAEVGFWIGVPYWGRGLMSEALGAIVGYGFERLGLNRIWGGHFAGNEASGRVQRKVGMQQEGVLRACLRKGDVYHDDVIHAVLRADYKPTVTWSCRAVAGTDV
jgi:RimJ/RimL family protein N-acetyltransferase